LHRVPPDHRRCTAVVKQPGWRRGQRCSCWRFGGGEFCWSHDKGVQELLAEFKDWLHTVRRVKVGPAVVEVTGFDLDRWDHEHHVLS
jgi:hypothetical protein